MMKRTRVDEVQYGTRPGPGGVGGSGGGGGVTSGSSVTGIGAGGVSVGTGSGVNIGTIVPGTHGATIGVGITTGISATAIPHHRILTPQHGGAQTIAYMPSTTPAATSNHKTSTIVDNSNNSSSSGSSASINSIPQIGATVVSSSSTGGTSSSGGIPTQYSTYSVSSIQTSGSLKGASAPEGTVQIHVTAGGSGVTNVVAPSTPQSNSIRQRTISGTQSTSSNISTTQQQLVVQTPPPAGAQPLNGPVSTSTPQSGAQGTAPRLKVEDALSYLDQVKYQYSDQPQIYNNFLDIMKEFKSHCIDTPGVIERVSTLFKGHSELIYGFNMFLPPGYKIEIHSDELGCSVPVVSMPSPPQAAPPSTASSVHNSSLVSNSSLSSSAHTIKTISTPSTPTTHNPSSITAQIAGGAVNLMTHGGASLSQTTIHALQPPSQSPSHVHVTVAPSPVSVSTAQVQSVSVATVGAAHLPQNYSRDRERATISQTSSNAGGTSTSVGPPTPNSLSDLSPHAAGSQHNLHHIQQAHQSILLGETTGQQNQPVEFNHAITYVNKIKNRFQNQPAKYKKFLEILHAYQKEQKVIKEGSLNQGKVLTEQEVYTQVAKLFGQDEDLLREFGQFLPDATNHQAAQYMSKTHNDHKRTTGTLSGGAQISMSPAPSSGSPLQLSSGATLSQIDNSAHAAAIGNLSAVNTSVSIKSFNNLQQNHVINTASTNATGRNDIVYEKDYHNISVHHHAASGGGVASGHHGIISAPTNVRTNSGSSGSYEKEAHRNNHHVVNQKFGHNQNVNVGVTVGHHHSSKKSPSYSGLSVGISGIPHITGSAGSNNNLDRNSAGLSYTTQGLSGSHHHISGSRRQLDDGGGSAVSGAPPAKRHKPFCRDVSFSEASRKCTISDAAFFDKVRKALRNPEVYDNFLRCLTLFNQEIVSKTELLGLVSPFLMKFPDLLRWFTEFLGPAITQIGGSGGHVDGVPLQTTQRQSSSSSHERQTNHQSGEFAQEIDLASCKRLGASYCALPQSTIPKKCSGRTTLCREVLNDKWVSFPTWASEDSTFVTSRKTQFEETIYRTEDERFELDLVIEVNSATIRVLEGVQKKMSRMPQEEVTRFHLDDYLGGTSQTIHQRAIHRIYGDKAGEIIQGLKKNPSIAVPIVLKRLRVKEEEWREAQKSFNKQWREQNEKYYLKSLDHQAINFKPNDMKALRSKSMYNEIETLYDERHDQEDENGEPVTGPHMVLPYKDKTILDDAANLLIHHVKRQTSIQKQEKTKIKHILRQFVPDLFFTARQPLSDDERDEVFPFSIDDNDKMEVDSTTSQTSESAKLNKSTIVTTTTTGGANNATSPIRTTTSLNIKTDISESIASTSSSSPSVADSSKGTCAMAVTDLKDATVNLVDSSSTILKRCDTSTDVIIDATDVNIDGIKVEIKQETEKEIRQRPQHAISKNMEEAYTLFFANNNWYLFFRLHAILCERLTTMYERARILTLEEEKSRVNRRESTATALRLKPRPDIQVEDYYPTFLEMLKNVLDGNMDLNTFEDSMREMFGIHAYISFTLDKVVTNAVRQLQNCVTERYALECVDVFMQEQRRGATGGFCRDAHRNIERELSYQRRAESALNDENCFKVYIYKIDCRVTIELLDSEAEEVEKPVNKVKNWNKYVDRLANPAATNSSTTSTSMANTLNSENVVDVTELKPENTDEEAMLTRVLRKPRFLKRNKRKSRLLEDPLRQLFENTNPSVNSALLTSTTTTSSNTKLVNANTTLANTGATATTTTAAGVAASTVTNTNDALNSKESSTTNSTVAATSDGQKAPPAPALNSWIVKRLPERIGTIPGAGGEIGGGISKKYLFNDRDEITVNAIAGRCIVTSKNLTFFKYDAVRRAKSTHLRVTQQKYNRFLKFQTKWLTEHVSTEHQQQCTDWLLGKTIETTLNATAATTPTGWAVAPKTKAMLQKDMKKTPYRVFNRYKVFPNGTVSTTSTSTTTSAPITGMAAAASSNIGKDVKSESTSTHCSTASGPGTSETTLQQVRPLES